MAFEIRRHPRRRFVTAGIADGEARWARVRRDERSLVGPKTIETQSTGHRGNSIFDERESVRPITVARYSMGGNSALTIFVVGPMNHKRQYFVSIAIVGLCNATVSSCASPKPNTMPATTDTTQTERPTPSSSLPSSPLSSSSSSGASATPVVPLDWSAHFADQDGCFAMLSLPSERWVVSDPARCNQRFRPFSTFKIANTMIGLETSAVADAQTIIKWDPTVYPAAAWWPAVWKQENNLQQAFQRSTVPYFRAMATRVGQAAMDRYLDRLAYGNRNAGGGLDSFWLTGDLAISAVEQIAFLRSIHDGSAGVSKRTLNIVKDIMRYQIPMASGDHKSSSDGYELRAKTGTGMAEKNHALSWYVGYIERGGETHIFAVNRSGRTYDDIPRKQTMRETWRILSAQGALPPLDLK